MRIAILLFVALGPTALLGCQTPREVANSEEIDLARALTEVADSLETLRTYKPEREKLGLIADEVTVTFAINAKATNKGGGQISVANIPALGVLGGGLTGEVQNEGSRGNTIVIKFKNLATADLSKGKYKNPLPKGEEEGMTVYQHNQNFRLP